MSGRFAVGAIVTFLAALSIAGWVVIVPIGAVSLLVHGFERDDDTATEGVLWASRITLVFSVLFGAIVAFGAAVVFVPRLAAMWAITLALLAFALFLLHLHQSSEDGDDDAEPGDRTTTPRE